MTEETTERMSQRFQKLLALLKELFQLDRPDLDFGFYRVMHAKSAEVTQFLERDLLPQVKAAFAQYQPADKAAIERELAKAVEQGHALGADPETLPKVQELRTRLAEDAVDLNALEAEVYDNLYGFFRRYYSEGDFLAKRVYKPGVYAVPYEGEEVTLHWANKDQYYIKTSEYLRDYAFRLLPNQAQNPMRVHFRLVDAAEGDHGNVKGADGKGRMFVLSPESFMTEEDGDHGKELVLRFEYRSATLDDWLDVEREGKVKPPAQKDLLSLAERRVLAMADTGLAPWIEALRQPHLKSDGERADYSRLRAHLNRYTARNTFDYFIHKDLGGFLRRELEFYIMNEIMHLDDVENETTPRVDQYLSKIRVIRRIAGKIIGFLAQLEDFQKKLWLKKKFVVETQYCISLDHIPVDMYPEIVANHAQREEWVKLFAINEINTDLTDGGYSQPLTVEFLKAHPLLPLDTQFFGEAFTQRLLEGLDLDESLTGLLIHGENQQAVGLIARHYEGGTKCVYLDPPYNTSDETFVYKNDYRHSSWLSMISDRVEDIFKLMQDDAILMIAIDDEEAYRLKMLLDTLLGPERYIGTVVVQSNPRGRGINSFFATSHEYCICYAVDPSRARIVDQPLTEDQAGAYRHADNGSKFRLLPFRRSGGLSTPDDRPNSEFAFYYSPSAQRIVAVGGSRLHAYPSTYEPSAIYTLVNDPASVVRVSVEEFMERSPPDTVAILPKDTDGRRRVWRWSDRAKIMEAVRAGDFVVHGNGDSLSIQLKDRIKEGRKPKTIWMGPRYDASSHGTNLLQALFGERKTFGYPKALSSTRDAIHCVVGEDLESTVLDLFGGSGTTAHAVIDLNREDNGNRRFVLVEAEQYFDTVMRPRVLKAAYAPEWRNGKPLSHEGGMPIALKYLRLESYEDALNNLDMRRSDTQQALLGAAEAQGAYGFREQYILRYMLNVETRGSNSLLNVHAFTDPTAYKLNIKRPGSDESLDVNVDLLETFNWLIGITVQQIGAPQTWSTDFERDREGRLRLKGDLKQEKKGRWWFRTVTGTTPDGRKTLVIWRKRPGGELSDGIEEDNLVLSEWFQKQGYSGTDGGFNLIYVNGGNNLESLKAPKDTWKVRLIEEDFHRLMFATQEG